MRHSRLLQVTKCLLTVWLAQQAHLRPPLWAPSTGASWKVPLHSPPISCGVWKTSCSPFPASALASTRCMRTASQMHKHSGPTQIFIFGTLRSHFANSASGAPLPAAAHNSLYFCTCSRTCCCDADMAAVPAFHFRYFSPIPFSPFHTMRCRRGDTMEELPCHRTEPVRCITTACGWRFRSYPFSRRCCFRSGARIRYVVHSRPPMTLVLISACHCACRIQLRRCSAPSP